MRVVSMGERALLVELPDLDRVLALYAGLTADPIPGQVDLVPGAESLLVMFDGAVPATRIGCLKERCGALWGAQPAGSSGRLPGERSEEHPERQSTGRASGQQGARAQGRPGAGPGHAEIDVVLDVVYDGPDLDEVGDLTGLGRGGVVAAHTGTPWRVAFCGFSPGFGYLAGGDPRLHVPRRESPRAEVPSGAVGLAGEYSGVYPRRSPGGWQLIGRTDADLWDLRRDAPALLRPGMTVRFRPIRPSVTVFSGTVAAPSAAPASRDDLPPPAPPPIDGTPALVVVRPGMQCTVQDLGRPGFASMGVSPSGVADQGAAARANNLVGNPADAAVLEILNGGAEFEARADVVVAVTGASAALTCVRATPAGAGAALTGVGAATPGGAAESFESDGAMALSAGTRLRIGRPRTGLRTYLAARGGFLVTPVLGSRSADTLAGLGPAPLRAGDVLPVGETSIPASKFAGDPRFARLDDASPAAPGGKRDEPTDATDSDPEPQVELAIAPGPQRDWLNSGAIAHLSTDSWTVSPASNRVGLRLAGPQLDRARAGELPSQGLVRGAVQVTPSDELVLFLADYPVTGGYPVIAVLTDDAADRAAQLRPGERVRFADRTSQSDRDLEREWV
jgi:biotin-dependent carboxylase-like uncharacterized protein